MRGISNPDEVYGTMPTDTVPEPGVRRKAICARCGMPYYPELGSRSPRCIHHGTGRTDIAPEHAMRIRAAYAIGRAMNPDHDTTSYYAQTLNQSDL